MDWYQSVAWGLGTPVLRHPSNPSISLRQCMYIFKHLKEHQRQNISQRLNWTNITESLTDLYSRMPAPPTPVSSFQHLPHLQALGQAPPPAKPSQLLPPSHWPITQYFPLWDLDNMTLELLVHPALSSPNRDHPEVVEGDLLASRSPILAQSKMSLKSKGDKWV